MAQPPLSFSEALNVSRKDLSGSYWIGSPRTAIYAGPTGYFFNGSPYLSFGGLAQQLTFAAGSLNQVYDSRTVTCMISLRCRAKMTAIQATYCGFGMLGRQQSSR